MAASQSVPDDFSFGPRYGDAVDVTLTFSNIIFAIVPSSLLLLAAVVHLQHYYRQPTVAVRSPILWARMATAICILGLSIAASVAWCTNSTYSTPTSIPAAATFSLAAAAIPVMVWIEHCKSTQSSFTVSFYILVSVLLDAVRARSFSMRPGLESASGLMGSVAALKFALAILLELPKQLITELEARKLTQEFTGGIVNRTFMAWINTLLLVGFRRNLRLEDLNGLDDTYLARNLDQEFTKLWNNEPKTQRALVKIFVRMFGPQILLACVPQVAVIASDFAVIFTMQAILQFLSSPESGESFTPGGLIAATTLCFLSVMVTRNTQAMITNRIAVRCRSTIFSQITKKVLRLPISKTDKSTALTHISADAEGITNSIEGLPMTLVAPFYVGVGLYVLYTVVGKAVALVVPPVFLFLAASAYNTRFMASAQKCWNGGIDARISSSASVLSQLRTIKVNGLAPAMARRLQSLREAEVESSIRFRKLYVIAWTTNALVLSRRSWPQIASMLASISRVQDFLLQDERKDPRAFESAVGEKSEPFAVSACDVSVAGKDDHSDKVLSGVSFHLASSSFVALIGPVGSGKSVFLKTLLGETNLASGTIQINVGSIAYCGQSPWIPSGTARDAIVGEYQFEESWYQTVVKACALDHDFARFSRGDLTQTGTNGSSLSGGQIRRLGLARAVYSKASLLLCDDVLSALDETTGLHIFHELFGSSGLLRKQNRTVVLTTRFAKWLEDADQIFLFDQGSARKCDLSEISSNMQQVLLARGSGDEDSSTDDKTSEDSKQEGQKSWEAPRISAEWSIYGFFFRTVPWYLLWPCITGIALMGILERFPDTYIRIWLAAGPGNKRFFIGMALFMGLNFVLNAGSMYLFLVRSTRITSTSIHQRFVDKVASSTLSFITSTNTGTILNKFSQDMTLVGQLLPNLFSAAVYMVAIAVQSTVLVAAGAQYAGLMIPALFIVLYYLQLFYLQSSRQMRLLDLESQTPLYAKITECTSGLEYIRAFGWETKALDKIYDRIDTAAKPCYYMFAIQRWLVLVLNGLALAMSIILVAIAVSFTKTTSQASLGLALVSLASYARMIEGLVVLWTKLETGMGAVRRIKEFVETTPVEVDKDGATPPAPNWPSRGQVVLKDVSCAYSEDEKASLALRNISLTVEAGQKAIVVGRTGSGKSSLLLTLLHCLHHTGSITIDGVDITDITHDGLRGAITTISQEVLNLPGSVRDNLLPSGPDDSSHATEENLLSVLDLVKLRDHVTKNGGLDAPLSDMHLSVGQKQLMGAARAIVHQRQTKGRLVLMDEVTSNMDDETDEIIQKVLDMAFADCTRIIISHRQASNANYDIVISLEDGRLVGVETWAERNQGAAASESSITAQQTDV